MSQDQTLHCNNIFSNYSVDNLLKDSKSININIDGSCFFRTPYIYYIRCTGLYYLFVYLKSFKELSFMSISVFLGNVLQRYSVYFKLQKKYRTFLKLFCFIYVLQIILSVLNLPLLLSGCKSS